MAIVIPEELVPYMPYDVSPSERMKLPLIPLPLIVIVAVVTCVYAASIYCSGMPVMGGSDTFNTGASSQPVGFTTLSVMVSGVLLKIFR